MVVTTPKLGLPKGQGPDSARDYLKGAISGGGLWRALEILDNAILSTGAITLDNATLNDPTIVGWTNANHTHSSAAQAGSTLGPGSTLSSPAFAGVISTGAQFAGNLGVGVTPAAWGVSHRAVQIGGTGAVWSDAGAPGATFLSSNGYFNGTNRVSLAAAPGAEVGLLNGGLQFSNSPAAAAGATQTHTTRLAVAPTGTLTLTPVAGQPALSAAMQGVQKFQITEGLTSDMAPRLLAVGAALELDAANNVVAPARTAAISLGNGAYLWSAVYAQTGTIQPSAADVKEAITPLDPADALAAVLATDPVTFTYTAPAPTAEQYELPDDPEQAEAVLHQRLVNAPLMEAARSQAGFVLSSPDYATDPLFETGTGQSNAANTAGVLLAAVKALATRVTALEGS